MLERLSTSQHDAQQRGRGKSERFHVFGTKKQVSFNVHIAELRAELMGCKQHATGQPCVLQWIRGDTVHVTEDSVGRTVLSWSDTYFAQVVTLQVGPGGFRPKECKFKVQQRGKTIAKTATLDLAKYCSEQGQARDQTVSLPLQPGGTLYFVISTCLTATDQQQQPPQNQNPNQTQAESRLVERTSSTNCSLADTAYSAAATGAAAAAAAAGEAGLASGLGGSGGRPSGSGPGAGGGAEGRSLKGGFGSLMAVATSFGAGSSSGKAAAAAAAAAAASAAGTPSSSSAVAAAAVAAAGRGSDLQHNNQQYSGDDRVRKSLSSALGDDGTATSSGGPFRKPRLSASGASSVRSLQAESVGGADPGGAGGGERGGGGGGGGGLGIFKRKARGASKQQTTQGSAGSAAGSYGAADSPRSRHGLATSSLNHSHSLPYRKSDSAHFSPSAAAAAGGGTPWDAAGSIGGGMERSLSQAVVSTGGGVGGAGNGVHSSSSGRAIRSFSCSPAPGLGGGGGGGGASSGGGSGVVSTLVNTLKSQPLMRIPLPPPPGGPEAASASAAAGTGTKNLGRASSSSRSDTGMTAAAANGAAATAAAAAGGGGGGSAGWGSWLRGGLGWGRSSNHSVTSATGPLSQASGGASGADGVVAVAVGIGGGAAGAGGGGGGGGGDHESSKLEAAIMGATEAGELREFAMDLLRERDEWRRRALAAQDTLSRAQMSRGAAVRESQRLEMRLKQYQDELGRRTDGSLIQELVEAKVRIAELANENMKLRRQITHMGPLFYDDSGDDGPTAGEE